MTGSSAFGMYLTTTIIWITAETRYVSIPSCFSYSVTTILGSRLILNLCDAYHNPSKYVSRGTSEWDTFSRCAPSVKPSIRFAANPANGMLEATVHLQTHSDSEPPTPENVKMGTISGRANCTKGLDDYGERNDNS